MPIKEKESGTKRFQFLKILIIKPFKYIIKCEKRTKQNSDYQKTSFVRFLYLRSDFCPRLSMISIILQLQNLLQKQQHHPLLLRQLEYLLSVAEQS